MKTVVWCLALLFHCWDVSESKSTCAHFEVQSFDEKAVPSQNKTKKSLVFEAIYDCPDLSELTVLVDWRHGTSPQWWPFCKVSRERRNKYCTCIRSKNGLLCQLTSLDNDFTDTDWKISGQVEGHDDLVVQDARFSYTELSRHLQFSTEPEERELDVSPGMDVKIDFDVQSYTKSIKSCKLTVPEEDNILNCSSDRRLGLLETQTTQMIDVQYFLLPSEVQISGRPPSLHLTVLLKNLTTEDGGTWQMSVENSFTGRPDIPNAHIAKVNFTLRILSSEATENTARIDEPRSGTVTIPYATKSNPVVTEIILGITKPSALDMTTSTSPMLAVSTSFLGFFAIATFVLAFIVLRRKGRCRMSSFRAANRQAAVRVAAYHADTLENGSERSSGSHAYEEVPDLPPPRPPKCYKHYQGNEANSSRRPTPQTLRTSDMLQQCYPLGLSTTSGDGRNLSAANLTGTCTNQHDIIIIRPHSPLRCPFHQ